MKKLIAIMPLILFVAGCAWNPFARNAAVPPSPIAFNAPPTKEQIVQTINENSAKIRQLQSDVQISVPGVPSISGTLAIERPRRLRLKAGLLGMTSTGIDAGSNDETFWLWQKTALPGQQPTMYWARHDEYANSPTRQMIPLDPSWIIESLGLVEIDPASNITGPMQRTDGNLEIHTQFISPQGPMSKIIVVDAQRGYILQQHVRDANGAWVASTTASKYQYEPSVQVNLPHHVEIKAMPGTPQEMSLKMNAFSYVINGIYADAAQLWGMPRPQGVNAINIAKPASASRQPDPRFSQQGQSQPNYTRRQASIRGLRGSRILRANSNR